MMPVIYRAFLLCYALLCKADLDGLVEKRHLEEGNNNVGENHEPKHHFFPWVDIPQCRAPRKMYDPKMIISETNVRNRNDPPLPYKNCNLDIKNHTFSWWGQNYEDRIVYERFFQFQNFSRPPFFVEMGGLNGLTFSNTFVLEQCLGWHGMLIEGNPNNFQQLVKNRPCTQNVWSIACPARKSHAYMSHAEGTSAVESSGVMVPCRTMASIFGEYGVRHIDFFSLDVEGFEYEVLSTINFKNVQIDVLITEIYKLDDNSLQSNVTLEKNRKVHQLLTNAGMFLVPSDVRKLPNCIQKIRNLDFWWHTLLGSSIYVSAKYRDDNICS